MKNLVNNILQIIGFIMIIAIPYSIYSGSFLFFIMGLFGFAIMMTGLLRAVPKVNNR